MLITAVIALLALLIATLSLGWQIAMYLLNGSRPAVDLLAAAVGEADAVAIPIQVDALEQLGRQGLTTPALAVQVQNRGRTAVSVTRWGLTFSNEAFFLPPDWYPNEKNPLPYRLEPGADVVFLVELQRVTASEKLMRQTNKPVRWCRGSASFGTGRTLQSKTRLPLPYPGRIQESQ